MHHLEETIVIRRIAPLVVVEIPACANSISGVPLIGISEPEPLVALDHREKSPIKQLLLGEIKSLELVLVIHRLPLVKRLHFLDRVDDKLIGNPTTVTVQAIKIVPDVMVQRRSGREDREALASSSQQR